jgi:hypothetical protein
MMTPHFARIALLAAALGLVACSRTVADLATGPDSTRNAARAEFRIEMEREGGIGTLWIRESVDGATGRYLATTHRICSVPQCQAAIDSASGTLDAATIDGLMAVVDFARLSSLRDDYGRTEHAADMMVHTLRVRHDGRTKTIRGDDGTFPDAARIVEQALHEVIRKARGM